MSWRDQLVERRVTGTHPRLGRAEIVQLVRRIVAGDPAARCGLELGDVSAEEVTQAAAECWGWTAERARGWIDPTRTVAAAAAARSRILEAGTAGARVAAATAHPASLLGVHQHLLELAGAAGAKVVTCDRYGPVHVARRGRLSLWWVGSVATATDGESIVGGELRELAAEWIFALGARPELAIADGEFAGAAAHEGIEVIALADLDALALGVAAQRGLPVHVVPVVTSGPPDAYEVLFGGKPHGPDPQGAERASQ